jgi:maltose O-acetyltransferase
LTDWPGRRLGLLLYYGLGRYLPPSTAPGGHWFRLARGWMCSNVFLSAGTGLNVESRAWFGNGRKITIGSRSGIGIRCALHGDVQIGNDVMMGPETLVYTSNHDASDVAVPMIDQGRTMPARVVIEDGVWIGARVIILPGVTIGTGSVIGAGSVVTRDVPPLSVVVGNPGRVVRKRASPP